MTEQLFGLLMKPEDQQLLQVFRTEWQPGDTQPRVPRNDWTLRLHCEESLLAQSPFYTLALLLLFL